MPSALETLVKILKLERSSRYQDKSVIGGLHAFALKWREEAHRQAKIKEHHLLVDEIVGLIAQYVEIRDENERARAIRHMLRRITNRVPPTDPLPPLPEGLTPWGGSDSGAEPESTPEPSPKSSEEVPAAVKSDADKVEAAAPEPTKTSDLNQPTMVVKGVGGKTADKLANLGIHTVRDLIYHLPRRYDDYRQMTPLYKLKPGVRTAVIGSIQEVTKIPNRSGKPRIKVILSDSSGTLDVWFFNQPWLLNTFKRGMRLVLRGKTDLYLGKVTMSQPEWEEVDINDVQKGQIVPIYALTEGIGNRTMRSLTESALDAWGAGIPDFMPESVLERTDFLPLSRALEKAHRPESWDDIKRARTRLTFDELVTLQLGVLQKRREWQSVPGMPFTVEDAWLEDAVGRLPFALTGAQSQALSEIRGDMATNLPMNRLLQGDVGSGKTVIAVLAMLIAVGNGAQAALMAPTSVLAEQHYRGINKLLQSYPEMFEGWKAAQGPEQMALPGDEVEPAQKPIARLLTGATPAAERDEILRGLADGTLPVVIGTHALIQEGVEFQKLGLAVIDEQHRFGVGQRGAMRGKGTNPHLLVMTATPIPRTLALTAYADLDLSVLDEMPPGRQPIETRVLHPVERTRAYRFIDAQINKGHQAYVIYPLVEDSDKIDAPGAVEEYERLQEFFPNRRLGLVHGRLPQDEKDSVMRAFGAGEIDILVATSVIEVGIDVPNATVIMIEGADRFGLAQLHQFRGRVGRGEAQSYCLLLGDIESADSRIRLEAMEETNDGFKLAELDWQMRGAGDLLGPRQSGLSAIRWAEEWDSELVALAQREARTLYAEDPALELPEHARLAARVRRFYNAAIESEEADIS